MNWNSPVAEEVRALAADRGAVILAHNYQVPEVQEVADYSPEVQEVVAHVGDLITQEQYERIYSESSERWKQDVTLEQSNETFKTLHTKLGKVESRALHSATEQENSGGALKGHVFILSYQTRFEAGQGMETFTIIEENGQWRLARYRVNSTALNQ